MNNAEGAWLDAQPRSGTGTQAAMADIVLPGLDRHTEEEGVLTGVLMQSKHAFTASTGFLSISASVYAAHVRGGVLASTAEHLGVDVKFILTPPCIFYRENC